ncbi:hypothetical protein OAR19_00695, partial [bacterium]|nr:hypothetical protein [bacterium]
IKRLKISAKITVLNYFWDFININAKEITADISNKSSLTNNLPSAKAAKIVKSKNVYIGKNVSIKPGVVLDADKGPILIDDNVEIFPNVTIIGPAYIGKDTIVKAGAKIYEGTSVGPCCKIGGELESTIFQGYSNKQHEGFLGHSYVGEWVNLGAGTENSDLKNNYSTIKVTINSKEIDSGFQFVGCCIGDHTKTGIKTTINTGSNFGVFCNVFGSGYQPKYLADFTWQDNENNGKNSKRCIFDKAIKTAQEVMKRRGKSLTSAAKILYKNIY